MVTMADIAQQLQLSTSTVSRALSGSLKIAARTVEKVHKAATEMGFVINADARNLRLNNLLHLDGGEKRVTISDLAELLDVSVSTVSRCLAGHSEASAKTRARVLKAAHKMGFIRQEYASRLRHGKPALIGVLLPSLDNECQVAALQGITRGAEELGFSVVVYCYFNKPASENGLFSSADAFVIVLEENASPNIAFYGLPQDKPSVFLTSTYPCGESAVTIEKGRTAAKSLIHQLLSYDLPA